MRSGFITVGRVATALIVFVVLCSGVFPRLAPRTAGAQSVEDMMPAALSREAQKAHNEYLRLMDAVNAAQSERLARKTAGAAEAELRDLDLKVADLVAKAEKLKVQADYLEELYRSKKSEYKSK